MAEMLWANPAVKDGEIAKRVGRSRQTVNKVKHTALFQQAVDEASGQYKAQLVVGAHRGLLNAFAKGRGAGPALAILQGRGIMPKATLEITGKDGAPLVPTDIAAQITHLMGRLGIADGATVVGPEAPAAEVGPAELGRPIEATDSPQEPTAVGEGGDAGMLPAPQVQPPAPSDG